MRIRYNFAFKDSKLSPWQRPAPPNILVSDASLNKKIIFLYKEFHKNSVIFYPSTLILILSFGIYFFNIFPNLTIKFGMMEMIPLIQQAFKYLISILVQELTMLYQENWSLHLTFDSHLNQLKKV